MLAWLKRKALASMILDDVEQISVALAQRGVETEVSVARHVLSTISATSLRCQSLQAAEREAELISMLNKATKWRQDAVRPAMSSGGDPNGDPEWASASLIETWHQGQILGGKAGVIGNKVVDWANRVLGLIETKRIINETWTEMRAIGLI